MCVSVSVSHNIIPASSAGHPGPGGGVQLCRHFGVRDPAPVCRESVWHHQGQDKVRRRGDIPHQGSTCSCALWISHLLSLNFGCDAILMFYARLFGQVKGAVRLLCSDTSIVVKSRPFWCTIMGPYFRKIMQGSERDAAWCCLVWHLTLWPFLCAEVMIMFEMSIEWDDVVHWAVPQNNQMYLTVKVKYIWLNTKSNTKTIH